MAAKLVIGNWKMHGSLEMASQLVHEVVEANESFLNLEVVFCPPFVYLQSVADWVKDKAQFSLGAQNVNVAEEGAFTGEVAAPMLSDVSCRYVLVGHSERRQYYGETNEIVAEKFLAAQKAGIVPVLCIGESKETREVNQTFDFIRYQLEAVFEKVGAEGFSKCVIAYEPIWAIGTGLTATPEQAQEVHAWVREYLKRVGILESLTLLYGGSVKAKNAKSLFAQPDIDGALVGGASLVPEEFIGICQQAV